MGPMAATLEHMLVAFMTQQINFNTLLLDQLVRSEALSPAQVEEIADALEELDRQDPVRSLTFMAEAIRRVVAPEAPPRPNLTVVKS